MTQKLYFITEAASIIGISTNQVRYIATKHKVPSNILNNRRYFTYENITKLIMISKKIYNNTKSPKKFVDTEYKLQILEKKLLTLKKQIVSLTK